MGMKNSALMFHYASKGKGRNSEMSGEYRGGTRYGGEHGGYGNSYEHDNYDRMSPRHGREMRGGYDMYDDGYTKHKSGRERYGRPMDDDDDDEDYYAKGKEKGKGKSKWKEKPLTEASAKEWVDCMENPEDKSKPGEHWNMAQTTQVLKQMKLPYDPVEFYAVMNMMYTDYFTVAKKYGQDRNTDFFVDMTKAWLDDSDTAVGNKKTEMYYSMIAK